MAGNMPGCGEMPDVTETDAQPLLGDASQTRPSFVGRWSLLALASGAAVFLLYLISGNIAAPGGITSNKTNITGAGIMELWPSWPTLHVPSFPTVHAPSFSTVHDAGDLIRHPIAHWDWYEAETTLKAIVRKYPGGCNATGIDCRWTEEWGCPGQNPGSKGMAKEDGTAAFECCCKLWEAFDDCVEAMTVKYPKGCRAKGHDCSWTQSWGCHHPGSVGTAKDDGTSAYECCCQAKEAWKLKCEKEGEIYHGGGACWKRSFGKGDKDAVMNTLEAGRRRKKRILYDLQTKPTCLLWRFPWCS